MKGRGGTAMQIAVGTALALCAMRSAASTHDAIPAWIDSDESIVVLESPHFYFDWDNARVPLRIDLFRCATNELRHRYPRLRLIDQAQFVKAAFPDLDPQAAPVSPQSLQLLLGNATLQQRIASLNLRYVVYGGTENDIETVEEGFGCVGGYGAALCGGGAEWKKQSKYDLLIFDLKHRQESRGADSAAGTSWFITILPLFVGWKSPTEARACAALGRDVLRLLEARRNGMDASPLRR